MKPTEEQLKVTYAETSIRLRAIGAGLAKIIADNETESEELRVVDELYFRWKDLIEEHTVARNAYYGQFSRGRRRRSSMKPRAKKKKIPTSVTR